MAKSKAPRPSQVETVTAESDELDPVIDLQGAALQATDFWEHHQKTIVGIGAGIIGVLFLIFAYNNFYKGPKNIDATNQLHKAELLYRQDSFALALKGTGGSPGLVEFAKKYSGTKAGNLANFYAGSAYLQLGQPKQAIPYLEAYSGGDDISPAMQYGLLGDAYTEDGKMEEGLKNYQRAATKGTDEFFTPYYLYKLGLLNEKLGKNADAKIAYEKIKSDYPKSAQARTIDIYIGRVDAK